MARRKSSEEETEPGPDATFEDALGKLEAIVEAMEQDHLPLEDLVAHYEQGTALLGRCEGILQAARGRIELITLRDRGEISLEAASQSAESNELPDLTALADDSDADDHDIRLF